MKKRPIGLFDSGLGGLSVLRSIHRQMPLEDLLYIGDSAHAPYGEKTREEVIARSTFLTKTLVEKGAKAIVIACNTATSVAVDALRQTFDLPIIGMEPALKVAIDGHYHQILVLATPMTLAEEKFQRLSDRVAQGVRVIPRPAPHLVKLVEGGLLEGPEVEEALKESLVLEGPPPDAIVLGCTHFVFLKSAIERLAPRAAIIDGNEGTARQLRRLLEEGGLLAKDGQKGLITVENTAGEVLLRQSQELLRMSGMTREGA